MGLIYKTSFLDHLTDKRGWGSRHVQVAKKLSKDGADLKIALEADTDKTVLLGDIDPNVGAFITGPVGVGKTQALTCLAGRHSASGKYYETLSSYLELCYAKSWEKVEILNRCKLLFLDDLFIAELTDWGKDRLFALVDTRYRHELVTYFATNLSFSEVSRVAGDRLASRIRETCRLYVISGDDRRQKIAS